MPHDRHVVVASQEALEGRQGARRDELGICAGAGVEGDRREAFGPEQQVGGFVVADEAVDEAPPVSRHFGRAAA